MVEFFKGIGESIKDFIMTNGENPIFWLILFFAGLIIFSLAYSALHRD